ncbi:MAG: L-aspartate oxidase [Woeseiaceae bacterium]|nr:L-aspartate oxidase [Woeseiaceae bacterium]
MRTVTDDVIVVGSGIAGLVCALSLAPRRVTLVTKTDGLAGGSSYWAKGGIAAAIGPGDSPKAHALDTLEAGAGLSHPRRALGLAEDGIESLRLLIDEGVPFDRALDGSLALAREAAHRHARVIHAGGDATGEVLVESLARRVTNAPDIEVLDNTFAYDLVVEDGAVRGLVTLDPRNGWSFRQASQVVLATGGIGMAWWHTTNPRESTGDGLAMAARAGARLTDLEFMQFHPTALAVGGDGASLPLLTEALRGAGALLIDETGQRFMADEHPLAELAPRDVVARGIHQRVAAGSTVYIDLRPVIDGGKADAFPQAFEAARAAGLDPYHEALPVTPAAHYHMGGVQTNRKGRTTIDGLWACGEVATTGIHGANRLASNSLLEGLVYARRVADDVHARSDSGWHRPVSPPAIPRRAEAAGIDIPGILGEARKIMSRDVGIARTARGMETALTRLTDLQLMLGNAVEGTGHADIIAACEARNLLLVSRLVTLAACKREESRGAHFRADFPKSRPTWKRRQRFTLDSANLETEALP